MMVSAVFKSGVVCTQCSGSLLKSLGRLGIGTIPGCKVLVHRRDRASMARKVAGRNLMMVSVAITGRNTKTVLTQLLGGIHRRVVKGSQPIYQAFRGEALLIVGMHIHRRQRCVTQIVVKAIVTIDFHMATRASRAPITLGAPCSN